MDTDGATVNDIHTTSPVPPYISNTALYPDPLIRSKNGPFHEEFMQEITSTQTQLTNSSTIMSMAAETTITTAKNHNTLKLKEVAPLDKEIESIIRPIIYCLVSSQVTISRLVLIMKIVGVQLADLTEQQKDELALLVAERVLVSCRHQKLSPQKQLALCDFWDRPEKHPQTFQVNDLPGIGVIWQDYFQKLPNNSDAFKNLNYGNFDSKYHSSTNGWHANLTHEHLSPGLTHLHLDTISNTVGDTIWT
ncbi:unnamed protein product [Ambrosiozyma monospora]|uniref:Unnamed protein product n=1 Tax=Ambrosiozyma monospora TaxID=43982 RepID=A0A9W6Z7S7_AMBMO|nr:unnamed protein product [Ambrosiozyma monospora]